MKVLMSADTIGGVWRYAVDLAAGLAAHDVGVHLATLGAPVSPTQRRELDALDGVTVHEGGYRLEWMNDPWDDLGRAGDWLLQLATDHDVDLVHLNHLVHGDVPFGVPVLTVVHSCVPSWWEAVHGVPAPAEWDRYRERVRASLGQSDAVVVATHAMQRAVVAHYGCDPAPRVIPNASLLAESVHRDSSCSGKGAMIVSAGRIWDEAKNVAALDRVASQLMWPVVVVGSDQSPDGQRAPFTTAQHAGVLSHDRLQVLLARAAIYALPARYEPFGLSVLEAAHAGCALVLGDIESLRENWQDAALFVDPRDDRALAEALHELTTNDELRLRMGRAAQHRARSMRFADTRTAYHSLYSSLALRAGHMRREGAGIA